MRPPASPPAPLHRPVPTPPSLLESFGIGAATPPGSRASCGQSTQTQVTTDLANKTRKGNTPHHKRVNTMLTIASMRRGLTIRFLVCRRLPEAYANSCKTLGWRDRRIIGDASELAKDHGGVGLHRCNGRTGCLTPCPRCDVLPDNSSIFNKIHDSCLITC